MGHLPLDDSYAGYAPAIFNEAFKICVVGPLIGILVVVAFAVFQERKRRVATTHGSARWGTEEEAWHAGLVDAQGIVLGQMPSGALIRENSKEHVACIAPTRSGKGVGQVIPTLLSWPGSVLVHDMKGENWAISSEARKLCTLSVPAQAAAERLARKAGRFCGRSTQT